MACAPVGRRVRLTLGWTVHLMVQQGLLSPCLLSSHGQSTSGSCPVGLTDCCLRQDALSGWTAGLRRSASSDNQSLSETSSTAGLAGVVSNLSSRDKRPGTFFSDRAKKMSSPGSRPETPCFRPFASKDKKSLPLGHAAGDGRCRVCGAGRGRGRVARYLVSSVQSTLFLTQIQELLQLLR